MSSLLHLSFHDSHPGFELETPLGKRLVFSFPDAPAGASLSIASGAASFKASDAIMVTVYASGANVFLVASQETAAPQALRLSVEGFDTACWDQIGWAGEEALRCSVVDGNIIRCDLDSAEIQLIGDQMRLEFAMVVQQESLSFEALSVPLDQIVVPLGKRAPEFSIGVFDDALYTRPRPLRFGIPVISTVPASAPGAVLSADDAQWLLEGSGPDTRTVYFRVVSSQILESKSDLTPLQIGALTLYKSELVKLAIYLPNGLDTIADPILVDLYGLCDSGTTKVVYYFCQYDFHREDTVNWVDGLCYLSVTLPLKLHSGFPLKFRVNDGSWTTPADTIAASF